jgi:hypothetical protein
LIKVFNNQDLRQEVRDTLGAELACRAVMAENETQNPWQSFHLSSYRAHHLLADHQADWNSYPVIQDDDGSWTVTANDESISCNLFSWRDFD